MLKPCATVADNVQPAPAVPRTNIEVEEREESDEDVGSDVVSEDDDADARTAISGSPESAVDEQASNEGQERRRKRKRKDADEELEDAYMQRLAREEDKDAERAAAERAGKRQKAGLPEKDGQETSAEHAPEDGEEERDEVASGAEISEEEDDDVASPPPKHETQESAEIELSKANRTVFLGNVSTSAISSKSARKTLTTHLGSFFESLTTPKDSDPKYKVDSLRFRSTPYASAIPKKAAYARKELMDATSKSTNAYAIYSSPLLAREAAKRLNGTVVLARHLRVDEVAHPAINDPKRCVFIGNLGFVDDESNIQAANEEQGREVRKRGKEPADVEEGLWRTFAKCGAVESVRVVRDSTTRVGKGIAYVQFEDENGVEAALLYNDRKFPPMLPRKLRVSRAKAQKRNAKPGSGRPSTKPGVGSGGGGGYQRKISGAEASQRGRVGKLYGRAAAAKMKQPPTGSRPQTKTGANGVELGNGIKRPEAFVFEGHRASSKSGKSGLKLGGGGGGKKKGKGKPTGRSAKRGAAYKAGGKR